MKYEVLSNFATIIVMTDKKVTEGKSKSSTKKILRSKKKSADKGMSLEVFDGIYLELKDQIEAHEKSVEVVGKYAEDYDNKIIKKLETVLKKLSKKGSKLTRSDLDLLTENLKEKPRQGLIFKKNSIVSMVSILDDMFSSILRHYYSQNHQKLSVESKSISFAELDEITKIEDAKNHILTKEIDQILLNEGVKNRFQILQTEMGIRLPKNQDHIKEINKLIKTRNLVVHNSCKADKEYVSNYGEGKIKIGDQLRFTNKNLEDSLALILFMGGYILQLCQLKHKSRQIESRDFILNDVIHLLVKKNNFAYLREIYDLSKNIKLNDSNKKVIVINYCIGQVKQGKKKKHILEILNKEDWSDISPEVKLCLLALKEEHKEFYTLLKKMIKDGIIGKLEILDWEIFTLYSKKPEFRDVVKNIIK